MGQEGGKAKIASGWPPKFDAVSRHSLTPGSPMTASRVQASLSQQLAASTTSRRRSVPPSPPEPVSQLLNQRWRERPRCPASLVAPGRRDGVVHAIVGRAACRCPRAQFVQDEGAAREHLVVSRFAGTRRPMSCTEIGSRACSSFHKKVARTNPDLAAAPSRISCWRRAQRRQCSSLRFDPAGGRAFGH